MKLDTLQAGRLGPVVLCILDGVGLGRPDEGNAVYLARTPNLDRLMGKCPSRSLLAHGHSVGLPSNSDIGNSEVGHNAIGAGCVVEQGAALVKRGLESGEAFESEVWEQLVRGKTLHAPWS